MCSLNMATPTADEGRVKKPLPPPEMVYKGSMPLDKISRVLLVIQREHLMLASFLMTCFKLPTTGQGTVSSFSQKINHFLSRSGGSAPTVSEILDAIYNHPGS
jgi:hypothetical protein